MKTELALQMVEQMPPILEEGIIYTSLEYMIAIHLCICGCKNEVVTPLNRNGLQHGWEYVIKDNKITLHPSIGNFNFPCKTHYFVVNNLIKMC